MTLCAFRKIVLFVAVLVYIPCCACAPRTFMSNELTGVREIRRAGGRVLFSDGVDKQCDEGVTNVWLSELQYLPLHEASYRYALFGDNAALPPCCDVSILNRFPNLRELNAVGVQWKGEVGPLSHAGLESVNLAGGVAPISLIREFARLKNIKSLNLSGMQLTDSDVELLEWSPQLRILYLDGSTVSPESVHGIISRSNVETVYYRCSITDDERSRIQQQSGGVIVTVHSKADGRVF